MQCVNLTDDDLWRAIANNTDAMSQLIQKQLELDAHIGPRDPDSRAYLMRFHVERANKFQHEYCVYTAELRRRYP
jgi:hypothetical protein